MIEARTVLGDTVEVFRGEDETQYERQLSCIFERLREQEDNLIVLRKELANRSHKLDVAVRRVIHS